MRWKKSLPVLIVALVAVVAVAVVGRSVAGGSDGLQGPPPAVESGGAHHFDVERVVSGLNRPTYVGAAPGDVDGLWVLEQPGRVVRVADGRRETELDLSTEVRSGAEQGLLGMAFHPDFARNGRFYLHWTDRKGDTRVAEFQRAADGSIDPSHRRELLFVDQPEPNHNGGQLAFGPDGRLYLGLGDGGGAFDPHERAQDRDSRLGKILALDVDDPHADWEVVLYGLRNPWRFSFDPALGEIWIGDVGQDSFEEVDRVLLEPEEPPKNLGWSVYEGVDAVGKGHDTDDTGELVWPAAGYTHRDGCSITGGVVYRGTALGALSGRYVYGDFCSGALWSLKAAPGKGATDVRRERAKVPQLTHIGTDADGELVMASSDGSIYRTVAPAPGAS